jgi:sarcosine oxidase subunit alpha
VGFVLARDGEGNVPAENHLVVGDGDIAGRVTSIYRSPTLQQVIGLAYVQPDQAQPGAEIHIRSHGGQIVKATVAPTPFFQEEAGTRTIPGGKA